jgi:hypothetical protein
MHPMKFLSEWEREEIIGVSGGFLPVYVEGEADAITACSCAIGSYMQNRYRLTRYDRLPGTDLTETKHALVMAHGNRTLAELKAWNKAKGDGK